MSEQIEVLGVRMECMDSREGMERLKEFLAGDSLRIVETVTAATLLETEKSEEFRQQIEQLNLKVIRDREVLEAGGITKAERLWEADANWFLAEFFQYLAETSRSLVILADTKEELERLQADLREAYPELKCAAGFCRDARTAENPDSLINRLNAVAADVILAALPSPAQEDFAYVNRQKLNSRIWVGIGCGGSVRKGSGGKQGFLEKLIEKRTFKRKVAEYGQQAGA